MMIKLFLLTYVMQYDRFISQCIIYNSQETQPIVVYEIWNVYSDNPVEKSGFVLSNIPYMHDH